jgi:hypothetical protein
MLTWDDKIIMPEVGRIDKIQILNSVRTAPIVGYLSPSQICDTCELLCTRKLDMEMTPDTLEEFLTKVVSSLVSVNVFTDLFDFPHY